MELNKKQRGLSLIELMIALALGILLLIGLGKTYQISNQTRLDTDVIASNAESARQVFTLLEHDFEHAGMVDLYDSPANQAIAFPACNGNITFNRNKPYGSLIGNNMQSDMNKIYLRLIDSSDPSARLDNSLLSGIGAISCGVLQPVFGCDGTISEIKGKDILSTSATCTAGAADKGSIRVAYQAIAATNINQSSLPRSAEDCTYTNLNAATAENNGFIVNQYLIKNDSKNNNTPSFSCRGNIGDKTIALVPGVYEMVIRYITTAPETNAATTFVNSDSGRVATAYRTASYINSEDAKNKKNQLGWSGVVGVEVCIVVATPLLDGVSNQLLASTQGGTRPSCTIQANGTYGTANKNDNNFYQRYVKTFSLPNALYAPGQ